jgi:hypothetical protein
MLKTQKTNIMKFYDEKLDLHFEILQDFMNNVVMPDGRIQHISSALPQVKSVDHTRGILIMKDNTIRCSLGCSSAIATYDGCNEKELSQLYTQY